MTRDDIMRAIADLDEDDRRALLRALRAEAEDEIGITNAAGERAGKPREFTKPRGFTAEDAALAMDAAPSSARGHAARDVAIERVAPFVGREAVLAQDSAEAVYRRALVLVGVSPRDLHAHALPAVFDATVRQQRASTGRADPRHGNTSRITPTFATDGITGTSYLPANVQKVLDGVRSLG